jgi:hypothetical protein
MKGVIMKKILRVSAMAVSLIAITGVSFACKGTVPAVGASHDAGTARGYFYTNDFCIVSVKADKTCSVRISSGGYSSSVTKNAKPFVSADANLKDETFFRFASAPRDDSTPWHWLEETLKSLERLNAQVPGAFVFHDLDEGGVIPPDATVINGRESYTVYPEPGKGVESWNSVLYLRGSVFDVERWRECMTGGGGRFYEPVPIYDYRAR